MEKRGGGPRILIVDDDASIRGLLSVIAGRTGILADEASDGIHALELLDRNPYDVVLLDLAMPRVNGFDVIERLRSKIRRPAVIVLTALGGPNFRDLDPSIVHCVIRKPFDLDLVMTLILSTATAFYERREQHARLSALRDQQPEARP
jgi:DNA-binding response OmpR family regulator